MKRTFRLIIVFLIFSIIVGHRTEAFSLIGAIKESPFKIISFINENIIGKIRKSVCENATANNKILNSVCNRNSNISDSSAQSQSTEIEKAITINQSSAISKTSSLLREIVDGVSQTLPGIQQITPSVVSYGDLNTNDILSFTNSERNKSGLPSLALNSTLSQVAKARAEDMFTKGYFEHVSPSGEEASTVATSFGYKYAVIGENIALGNFKSSQDVVNAWMASPGHRENILKSNYQEIGIYAKEDSYNGSRVWIAVQIFAKSTSACGYPDESIKSQIENLSSTSKTLYAKANEISALLPSLQGNASVYNAKVSEYNSIAQSVNALSVEIERLVKIYNASVNTYNACVENI